jgi:hypothetical protein
LMDYTFSVIRRNLATCQLALASCSTISRDMATCQLACSFRS